MLKHLKLSLYIGLGLSKTIIMDCFKDFSSSGDREIIQPDTLVSPV